MERILMKGNEIIGEAAIRSGCRLFFGYPITPSTEVVEYLSKHLPQQGGTVLQAEDEIAAISMCYGAAATGSRVMTASSSPGISLKQEGISYSAAAELPIVIVNVNRCGPGLGGLGPAQSDYFQSTKGGGHGDYRLIVLGPSNAQELYDFTMEAFDLADKYRNPVLILSDGFLGQTMEPIILKDRPKMPELDRSWTVGGCKGREKRIVASYSLTNEIGEMNNQRWEAKYKNIEEREQRWEAFYTEDAEYLLVSYGTTGRICKSTVLNARKKGIKLGLIRPITLWPFPNNAFLPLIDKIKGIVTVELNTGQMIEDVKLAVACKMPVHLYRRQGGMLPTEHEILDYLQDTFGELGEV
ncbi:2-oxoglutarate ferredoxin oxidoreductase subunit alpha [Clostridium aceticum]|uniref:2-oxoglutarate ferredoxin oxidoreductase subunit alpha n=1 Tax=Clostridium aceticum TaxID=84022 RepID=A0A0D8I7I9_9CLOT|nr:3-methyl-2-oxobutanoate dehydrogenase subunit VorB [Clostridium aceticum]AKL97225.1 2-oxoglutarate ferredoxin oxidoreductase subunit alpha [Clostridium aceticum]KJF26255.1 2-ketoisovalerate ferredoxin oxidoreductase [Clostridium aceticum]